MQKQNGTVVSVYFSDENAGVLARLDRLGQMEDRSRSWLIVDAIERYVEVHERVQFPGPVCQLVEYSFRD